MHKTRPIKILIAKAGLDGHERGAMVVAQGLRDAGMEVIYTGIRNTPEQIVSTAIQEDVDAIGLSSLSGAHLTAFKKLMKLLKQEGSDHILVFGGGIFPPEDITALKKTGIKQLFGPGTRLQEIVEFVSKNVKI